MVGFTFLLTRTVLAAHAEQIATHGGIEGLRHQGLLDSALARPRNRSTLEADADCATLAADYAFGIARNHPFIDGNKRIAFIAMQLFLSLNHAQLVVSQDEALRTMLALAAGEMDRPTLVIWIRKHLAAV